MVHLKFMKTKLGEISEQLGLVSRGCLPYAPNAIDEITVCDAALAELDAITKQVARIRRELKARRAEFASLLEIQP